MPTGHEIIVDGKYFAAGTRVITWQEPDGYNAYAVPPPAPGKPAEPYDNHGVRKQLDSKNGEWVEPVTPPNLADLRELVDQFVLHYDSKGLSRPTFAILQKRGLSSHFLLDVDGTIYQTLDLRDRAYHATVANSRSVGIEIANIGAYPPTETKEINAWYGLDANGHPVVHPPLEMNPTGVRTPNFTARPARAEPVRGVINGQDLVQYDFTPEQYAALSKLVAALHQVFPKLALDYPRDAQGKVVLHQLSPKDWAKFHGVLGHFHVQANKIDPGPAFDWDRVIDAARQESNQTK